MRFYHTFILFVFCFATGFSQEKQAIWNSYLANHENGIGSTSVRMDLIDEAPVNAYDYIASVQISYAETSKNGLPNTKQLEQLYRIEDSIRSVVNRSIENYHVGSFTYQNFRREFFYLKDTVNFRKKIDQLFRKDFKSAKYVVKIEEDQLWSIYTGFLYPNDYIKNFMYDRDAVLQLRSLGDDAEKVRKIEFFAKFTDEKARATFAEYLKNENYTISTNTKTNDKNHPYELVFWKASTTTLDQINELTSALLTASEKCSCMYEGWETVVIKKKEN